ncbi:MAG: ATP-dependent helicase [Actinomycetota bacterium]
MSEIFEGLNAGQRAAVEAVRGPVCILAGAGSGKTTTITRRLAHQVASQTFEPGALLAVTFTDKAAREMKTRLERLNVKGMRTRTFHAAALQQLRYFRPGEIGQILASKAKILAPMVRGLGYKYRFMPLADFASEIEWAKNQRITPDEYVQRLHGHEPPVEADVMQTLYARYEDRKRRNGTLDFEDMLERAIAMFDEDEAIAETFRNKYLAFTVDEYQDVNLLQQTLLERWLGGRDDLCVVGDDYQAIYSFTGASPEHLLTMPQRYVGTKVFRLEDNYRSTPQVLEMANHLVGKLGGSEKVLRPTRQAGPEVQLRGFMDPDAEPAFIADEVRRLHEADGVPYEAMVVLYRINARSEDYEELFADAGIPYQVRDDAFLERAAARQLLPRLSRQAGKNIAGLAEGLARKLGYTGDEIPEGAARNEITRQKDFQRLIRLADEFEDGARTPADFVTELQYRFHGDVATGVNLSTLHRAKGLEFDAVFIPSVVAGELPWKRSDIDEERRLFYVGLTRAKRYLYVTWAMSGKHKASMFVTELRGGEPAPTSEKETKKPLEGGPLVDALKAWRLEEARSEGKPAYVIFHDATLAEIAAREPSSLDELMEVPGIGPTKIERYGAAVLSLINRSVGS